LNEVKLYDVAIVGGGLAGLSLSIQLLKSGYSVIVFEKEKYPFHKVCGEYISFESWNFLEEAGVPLSDWDLPIIKRLVVSAPNGKFIEHELPLGGFGISRYKLDSELASICRSLGGSLHEDAKVTDISFENKSFRVQAGNQDYRARIVCGTYGKRSNLDIRWKRRFTRKKNNKLNNFIAVKYHVLLDSPPDLICLHNFRDGYCGLSQIEHQRYCLCYLTTANNLQRNNNSLEELEKKNSLLKPLFAKNFCFRQIPD